MQSNNPYNHPTTGERQLPPHNATAGVPSDAPPSYDNATGPSPKASAQPHDQTLHVPSAGRASGEYTSDEDSEGHSTAGIPNADRLSMEEERRELPIGWIRQFDSK